MIDSMADHFESRQFLQLESRISPHKPNTQRKLKVKKLTSAKNQNYHNISCQVRVINLSAPKVRVLHSAPKKVKTNTIAQDIDVIELKNNIVELKAKIAELQEEKELTRRNLLNEIQFNNRQNLSALVMVQQLVKAKQYQRLAIFAEAQLLSLKKRLDLVGNSDQDTFEGATISQENQIESSLEEDPSFNKLISNLQENLKQIHLDDVGLLPQIKKLSMQSELSIKKLAWFFSQVPFEMQQKQQCKLLAGRIIKEVGLKKGCEVLQLIIRNLVMDDVGQNDENCPINLIEDQQKKGSKPF